ncbi:phenylalanine--tRNA ligase [Veillonella montpellierensis DNF00314]|uniref:Phenylalanine--tRNA ligase alpha subunit n=1 Tax=Veillonella montpellierensis DNF00314 TaxID=1401067 RepID=A0A096AMM8_9FIRM|nr:phenylalanine--tRNA ligase subunit alpha [Veillonella montpellierensis]KGF47936.1 phenylalanine--tRNA ligase [Veillonella montpellierensis DNF00314]
MEEQLKSIKESALSAIHGASNNQELQDIRVKFLGKKGELTALLKGLGKLSKEERPAAGAKVNEARVVLEEAISALQDKFDAAELKEKLTRERIDITLPGRAPQKGHMHPLTIVNEMIEEFFMKMGYTVEEGPEIEQDYYNFECLNLPKDHPARDMQDSFYITDNFLLRTHTSPVQARTMQAHTSNAPIRMIAPGKVYRWDYDATHSPVFHQVEGLLIDKDIKFSDLKGTLELFLKYMFGEKTKIRFRTSFFPFTEPSAEVDISCVMCGGEGCRVCSHTGWLEILGCGMVHPNVLRLNGYDPEKVQGFAFGMGVERIAMLLYGINDLRLFFEDDTRFLKQF